MTKRLTDEELYDVIGRLSHWIDEGQELIETLTGELHERQPGIEMEARHVPQGSYFRKRTGSVLYMRISESAAKHNMRDPSMVYGIADYGNMTDVKPETKVVAIPPPNSQYNGVWRDLLIELGLFEEPEEDK